MSRSRFEHPPGADLLEFDVVVDLLNRDTKTNAIYHPWTPNYSVESNTEIVVNATSIGLYPNINQELDVNFESLKSDMVVADGIHNPPETHFLRTAKVPRNSAQNMQGVK